MTIWSDAGNVKDDAGNVCLNYLGTQIDLRDETSVVEKLAKNRQKPITLEHGEKLAKELKAGRFFVNRSTITF